MKNFRLNKLNILMFLLLILFQQQVFSQVIRQFKSAKYKDGKINVLVSDGVYKIIPFNNKIIKTTFYQNNAKLQNFSYASYINPKKINIVKSETPNYILFKIDSFSVKIQKKPLKISYLYKNKLLISENKGYIDTDSCKIMNFTISNDEILYGGGERVLGMNRRGNRLKLYNRAHYGYETNSVLMNYSLPLFISSKKYAVLFDNASSGFLDLDSKANNTVNYETVAGNINYYVIAANDWYDLINQYTYLTGRQPLPPRWIFGNISSRFGYHSQAETERTVNKFFEDDIPLDAVILDIYWFGKDIKGTMGNLDWYRDSFPNPQKMIKKFNKKGVKTILITEPFVLTTSKKWKEAVDNNILALNSKGEPYCYDFYFGNTGLIDIFNPKAQKWFWNIYKKFINQGVGGWWGDLGEPEVHPDDMVHINGLGKEVHNAYGHIWAKTIYEGYKRDFPNQRPFILMRSGYAGSQRYGIIPWTGDVNRTWGGLMPQPELALQMGMQGIAYTHSDLGGFAGGDSIDNELYIRWLQYGVFQPVFRPHAQEQIAPEPVFQSATTKALVKKAIELRYQLKPYIYNMAYENSTTGKPLMTPLFFDEDFNKNLLTYDTAYMWGDAFLVSPVKERGKKTQKIYFPANSNWYDFYTDKLYNGGNYHTVDLTMEHIPVFVKAGSFIPMSKKAVNEKSYSLKNYELHYYADNSVKNSSYTLYNDDGKTPEAFNKGKFELTKFQMNNQNNNLNFTIRKTEGKNIEKSEMNNIELIIHNLKNKPKAIIVNGKKLNTKKWNWQNMLLSFSFKLFHDKKVSITVE